MKPPRHALVMAAAVFATVAPARAQSDPPAETRPVRPFADWIADLDADDFAKREAAAAALVAAGEAARDALEAAREQGSLERRLRIAELLGRLGVKTAASRPSPRRSLAIPGGDLAGACEALEAAFGRRFRVAGPSDGALAVDVRLEDAAFFPALDAVCAAAGATFYRDARDGAFVLRATPEKPGPVAYADGHRVALTQLNVNRIKRFGGTTTASAYLQLQIDADPDSGAVGVMAPVVASVATDDQGRSLLQKTPAQASYVQRFDVTGRVPVAAPLVAPEADAKSLRELRFDLKLVVPEKTAEVEIPNPSADPAVRHGDGPLQVVVEEWRATDEGVTVKLVFDRPAPTGDGPPQANVFDDRVVFLGADGKPVEPRTTGTRNLVGKGHFQAELPPGTYSAVRVSCLVSYVVRDVSATFAEVPLP